MATNKSNKLLADNKELEDYIHRVRIMAGYDSENDLVKEIAMDRNSHLKTSSVG